MAAVLDRALELQERKARESGEGGHAGRFLPLLRTSNGWLKPPLPGFRLFELSKAMEGCLYPKFGEKRREKREVARTNCLSSWESTTLFMVP